ncbi:hypothetical protein Leryth_025929, partial [Lithospermum erythrorhizon]
GKQQKIKELAKHPDISQKLDSDDIYEKKKQQRKRMMEKAKEALTINESESVRAEQLRFPGVPKGGVFSSFYERFILHGIRVDRLQPGFISCSFTVPPHLTDKNGYLQNGAVASLVDEAGFAVVHEEGSPMMVSVDMSIAFISTAKLHFYSE